jgi:hypothetical protein
VALTLSPDHGRVPSWTSHSLCKLQYESCSLLHAQGEQQTDFKFQHPGGVINIQGCGPDLLYEANAGGATASFKSLSGSTSWSDGGYS